MSDLVRSPHIDIATEIPINGYTLYAEEPVEQLSGTDLEGRTMFMTPTSTKALIPTRSANIPRRRSEGHKVIIDGKKRIVNSFLTDATGNVAEVNYIELNGSPYAGGKTQFLVAMCNDADVLLKCAPNGASIGRANVSINNPYIVTPQNPVFTAEDFDNGLVPDRAREIMDLGYDAIIMDYNSGDNYMVMAFDKKSVVKLSDRDAQIDFDDAVDAIQESYGSESADVIAEMTTDAMNTIKLSDRDSIHRDETYSIIGKELLSYEEGNMAPDLTLVETFNERTGKTETTIKHYGQKPKNYIPKKIAYCYKLFEQHPDGSLHALFAGAKGATPIGVWQYAQGFPYTDAGVKGMNLRERYGWRSTWHLPPTNSLSTTRGDSAGGIHITSVLWRRS